MNNDRFRDKRKAYLQEDSRRNAAFFNTNYAIERFLKRAAVSTYRDHFILKGGYLIGLIFSQHIRPTRDIDITLKNASSKFEDMAKIITEICAIDVRDGMEMSIEKLQPIKGNEIYPAIRIVICAKFTDAKERTSFHLDLAIGDVITPEPELITVNFLVEEVKGEKDSVQLYSYPIPTILAEKLHTILERGDENTRAKDFYDIHLLLETNYDISMCLTAFKNTVDFRHSSFGYFDFDEYNEIIEEIRQEPNMLKTWEYYVTTDAQYAKGIFFLEIVERIQLYIKELFDEYQKQK